MVFAKVYLVLKMKMVHNIDIRMTVYLNIRQGLWQIFLEVYNNVNLDYILGSNANMGAKFERLPKCEVWYTWPKMHLFSRVLH